MAEYVFKKNNKGIQNLLKSSECLKVMEGYAQGRGDDARPFIGFDRAKVFVKENKK